MDDKFYRNLIFYPLNYGSKTGCKYIKIDR